MPINTLNFNEFMSECANQQLLASLFASEHRSIFKYSKKYLYYYNEETTLWELKDNHFLIEFISNWFIIIQEHFIQTKKYESQDQLTKLIKEINRITGYHHCDSLTKYCLQKFNDETLFDKLDRAHPYLISIKGHKVVDLRTGLEEQRKAEHYFTYEYNATLTKKETETFKTFISQIMINNEDSIKYLQKILGYTISGVNDAQCIFIGYGKGANGKSVLLNLLQALMGKACRPASKEIFISSKKTGGSEVIAIKDARLITFSETKKKEKLNEEVLKQISGGDTITARALYREPIDFKIMSKLFLCSNARPEFDGNDFAMVRRIKYLPFEAKFNYNPTKKNEFKINKNLLNQLIENNLDEFLSFCVKGAIEYFKNNEFDPPTHIKTLENKYIHSQASIQKWFEENIIESSEEEAYIPRAHAYDSYKMYCEDEGLDPLGKSNFYESIEDILGETKQIRINKKSVRVYTGYSFRNNNEQEEETADNLMDI